MRGIFFLILILNFIGLIFSVAEDCALSKREDRCGSIFEDLTNCYNSTFKMMLGDCLVTCNACESYTCNNPQPDTTLNCTALAGECNSALFSELMKEKCPATCGKCNRKNANLCSDKSKPDICVNLKTLCNSVEFYDKLSEQCPSTCNRCPHNGTNPENKTGGNGGTGTQECTDLANDCSYNQNRCSVKEYSSLMHRLCPKTCNACNICEDANKMCPIWVPRGFCSKFDHDKVQKSCAKSCNICK
ncbi:uncharacterized protein CELE_ZK643.6 [Caenorhabditis elegans]|uniref:Uncharacterized protein ZK643.6 n=1 Tax=Caenorhabditis elegans TaxID=6239 RepID=YOW6_CAEEL|nr:Uncharacterized protein CELE_ZK643.6 [Caenorhabditis elegans]P30652.3 RecName: Full=Uncharacterized protein ZK643.6; Flags: Precursor [Caenorhabditis elegans]CAA77472.3 Uncharacterized protein CELE_ZK643.6 [Caenorhabditis elegans]|eukprot:NP_498981.2 Uncharacterized protein CELE_ZK643.6 [Caenorhabditis elegans]